MAPSQQQHDKRSGWKSCFGGRFCNRRALGSTRRVNNVTTTVWLRWNEVVSATRTDRSRTYCRMWNHQRLNTAATGYIDAPKEPYTKIHGECKQCSLTKERKRKAEGPMKMQNTDTLAFSCLLSNRPKVSDKNSKFLMLAQVSNKKKILQWLQPLFRQ